MALGNNNYNRNQGNNQLWEPSYYSRLRIKNYNENLVLSFNFWKGTLKVIISEVNAQGQGNDLAYIHLSPTKAHIMADAVKRVMNTENNVSFGVDTGSGETRGFIAVGKENNVPYLVIAKVNADGSYESCQRFNFNNNYNYILNVHDVASLKCQKEYMNNVELIQLHDMFADYSRCASGAIGASFHDIGRYESAKTSNLIKKIAQKVGHNACTFL